MTTSTASPPTPPGAGPLLAEYYRRLARTNPAFFAAQALGDGTGRPGPPAAAVHVELQHFLTAARHALVELPRDHGKTTQLCGRAVWELGRDPMLRIKFVCGTESIARDRGRYLQYLIQLDAVRRVFPGLRPAKPWTPEAFTVARPAETIGPSVACLGVGNGATGTRADLLILDDVADVTAAFSAAARDRVGRLVTDNLLNLLEPGGRCWSAATPWHPDDAAARLKRTPGFALFRRAVGPAFEPVWPEKWPRAALERRAAEIGPAAFARGFRLTPVAEGECPIRPDAVQYYSAAPAQYDRVVLSIDPAVGTGPNADRTALVTLGLAGTEVHVIEAFARRVAAPDLLPLIAAAHARHNPAQILFESNAAFEAVRALLAARADFGPKFVKLTATRSKAARVLGLSVGVQQGAVKLRAGDGAQRELFDEMVAFPFGDRDDLVDALAGGAAHLLTRPREPRIFDFPTSEPRP